MSVTGMTDYHWNVIITTVSATHTHSLIRLSHTRPPPSPLGQSNLSVK